MQKIIVDGYNVIHADEHLKRTAARDLERARGLLIELVTAYLKSRGVQVTLVFDGAGGLTDVEPVVPGKLQVLFSSTRQTADELILKTLADSQNPREYIVVTSDMTDIGRSARGMGSEVLSSRGFLDRIGEKAGKRERSSSKEGKDVEPEMQDVDFWLSQFGEKPHNDGKKDTNGD